MIAGALDVKQRREEAENIFRNIMNTGNLPKRSDNGPTMIFPKNKPKKYAAKR